MLIGGPVARAEEKPHAAQQQQTPDQPLALLQKTRRALRPPALVSAGRKRLVRTLSRRHKVCFGAGRGTRGRFASATRRHPCKLAQKSRRNVLKLSPGRLHHGHGPAIHSFGSETAMQKSGARSAQSVVSRVRAPVVERQSCSTETLDGLWVAIKRARAQPPSGHSS